jgi:putative transcriptional regulator
MEIQANAWLNCAADDQLVFDEAIDRQWSRALKSLGAEALTLSTEAGHA